MIDLKSLERALNKISEKAEIEKSFNIDGLVLVLRAVSAEESVAIQKEATGAAYDASAEGLEFSPAIEEDFVFRMKVATLSYSIAEVAGTDLRHDFVHTGKFLNDDQDRPIKEPKFKVMKRLVRKWPAALLDAVFARYGEVMEEVMISSEKLVGYSIPNLDFEINRLEERRNKMIELRDKKLEARILKEEDFVSRQRKETINRDRVRHTENLKAAKENQPSPALGDSLVRKINKTEEPVAAQAPPPPVAPREYREPVQTIPKRAAPPVRRSSPPIHSGNTNSEAPVAGSLEHPDSSFQSDSANIESENARLLEMRAERSRSREAAAADLKRRQEGAMPVSRRVPPHLAAKLAQNNSNK